MSFKEWMNEWKSEWMSEWVNITVSEWVSKSEWMNEWKSKRVKEWVNERVKEWKSEWVNEWMNEWMSEWKSEWVNEWIPSWINKERHPKPYWCTKLFNENCWRNRNIKSTPLFLIISFLPSSTNALFNKTPLKRTAVSAVWIEWPSDNTSDRIW